jgi:hypothetical protein
MLVPLALLGCDRAGFEPPSFDAGPEELAAIGDDRDDGTIGGDLDARAWQHIGVAFYRFRIEAPIAAGAHVQHARLRLWGTDRAAWSEERALTIALEDSADAPRIDDARARPAGAPVRWQVDWRVDGWNQSPDLSSIFEALIATHGGLAAGAHVQLYVASESDDAEVMVEDFSNLGPHHAELRLRTR